MKVIILAGGFGTRLSEYTETIPKPMVPVGGKPIFWHIMQRYAYYGHKDFYLALGYKSEIIKEYFLKFGSINSDFSIDLSSGKMKMHNSNGLDWKVTLVNTGQDSMTGGRVKRMQPFIGDEPFMLTYGDGVADIDINALVYFHLNHGKMVTVTAVHPVARFGELEMAGERVISFQEKPQVKIGWINGGFFICHPDFFNFIEGDKTVLEREPLEMVAKKNELMAFKHEGFWQCMDTKRDKDLLEELWQAGSAPWKV
ncbi:glucose-1-phosphate cytidylyltransferase [Desulfobacula sp.]|uniref:glucose-1-phosphate cytidylyltransferase n=1 Tax=Desulfobacula sp. TaxID=2593537 RepID=UPI001EC80229|nr:glucose-1-phosphate cytidylyltransferase [Desulfobacula sp.]